jgi:N-methylhydantoinase A/oxoprolinase/acetone carboxylase beta subunit
VGKASTTRQDLEKCFFESIAAALRDTGKKLEDILKNTRVIGYGTTQGTNVIVSGIGAPNLGSLRPKGKRVEHTLCVFELLV